MARINSKNIISGNIANLIYRNLDGRQIVQIHPGKIKQTKATKASSSEFRQSSMWAKHLRIGLAPFLVDLTDSYMYRRLTGRFYHTLLSNTQLPKGQRTPLNSNMKNMEGFEFNLHSPFKEYFMPSIEAVLDTERRLHITVPPLDPKTEMSFPEMVQHAELMVLVYATTFEENSPTVTSFFTVSLNRNTPLPQPTEWTSTPLPEHHFILATAKLLFYTPNPFTARNYWNSKILNPAKVVFCEAGGA